MAMNSGGGSTHPGLTLRKFDDKGKVYAMTDRMSLQQTYQVTKHTLIMYVSDSIILVYFYTHLFKVREI